MRLKLAAIQQQKNKKSGITQIADPLGTICGQPG